jgi:hypothetical protein
VLAFDRVRFGFRKDWLVFRFFSGLDRFGQYTGLDAVFSVDLDLLAAVLAFLSLYTQLKTEGFGKNSTFLKKTTE